MKNAIYLVLELIILSIFDNKIFNVKKRIKPSLLSLNIVWFTNCGWVDQMIAFKQIKEFYAFN
jgi:hypothetical protein